MFNTNKINSSLIFSQVIFLKQEGVIFFIILGLKSLIYTSFYKFIFLIKWLFHVDLGFILFFVISSSCCLVWFCVVLLRYFVFRRFVATFYLCVDDSDG